ncbi:LOW QUALITY PROTEIN: pseudouridine synthase 10 [Aphomia sociella]
MNQKVIFKFCKDLGCCDSCCLRYLGVKNRSAYENPKSYALKFQESTSPKPKDEEVQPEHITIADNGPENTDDTTHAHNTDNVTENTNGSSPPMKRRKMHTCVSCLGVLQEHTWSTANEMVQEMLTKKSYECSTFACALSAPIATLLRERAITLFIGEMCPEYDSNTVCPLKEAWKWSYAVQLATRVLKRLDSGAVSPLLITLNIEYPDEMQELEILKILSPSLFQSRSQQKRRFTVEFTRRSAEQALSGVSADSLRAGWAPPAAGAPAVCVSVVGTHAPVYLGGRYIKLSRELPQTPWLVGGVRMMESSVQEIIFAPLAAAYGLTPEECEHRLKFMSAGREDVDVRCLGDGRPFAVEITDPRRELTEEELKQVCKEISADGKVVVNTMVHVSREELTELKKGEESKCKTYEALCIKLEHSEHERDKGPSDPITVTAEDIHNINTYTNTAEPGVRVRVSQKTPVRVLHRRPLLTRTRDILDLTAAAVPGHPQLVALRIRTSAGTYVKEWAHGDLRRCRPALQHALRAAADLLALDVAAIHLDWPSRGG